jgi:hypothetical protein
LIKTIKQQETYYTYDDEHDDPDASNLHYHFPNEQVGIGATKQSSQDAYRIIEKGNAELREWAMWLQKNGVEAYLNGNTEKENKL